MTKKRKATELEWLRWFHCNADFGPADGDVRAMLKQEFISRTNKDLPEGYDEEEE